MDPFHAIFLVGFVVYVVTRGVYAHGNKPVARTDRRTNALEVVLLVCVGVGSLLLPVVFLATPWLAFADYVLPTPVRGVGVAVLLAALWLFWRSHADLGLEWSPMVERRAEGHRLVDHGVYRRVRHPMYAAIHLVGLAQGLLLSNWLAGWFAFVTFALLYVVRVPNEERLMLDTFGEPYRAYMVRTGRLFPRFGAARDGGAT